MKNRSFVILYLVFGVLGWTLNFTQSSKQSLLSPAITLSYVQASAWYQSRSILSDIESLLDNDEIPDTPEFKMKIYNTLDHQLFVFINDMNSIPSQIHDVGDLYYQSFRKDSYSGDIYQTIQSTKEPYQKINMIRNTIQFYQNEAITSLKEKIKQ